MADEKKDPGFRTFRGYQLINRRGGRLSPAMEDYLEMIYRLCSMNRYTRVGKLSEILHVKPSSASKMIFKLAEAGYIRYDRYEIVQLTERGTKTGDYLLQRHNIVDDFLKLIGSRDSLEETELVEHSLGPFTVGRLRALLEFFKTDASARNDWAGFLSNREQAERRGAPPVE